MLIGVSVLTFSSLVYFAEKGERDDDNWSFMDSFWWGLFTITTVGNGKRKMVKRYAIVNRQLVFLGQAAPETNAGKFVGTMCAVFAIFTLILPIPIVVNSFSAFYRNRLWRNEVALKKQQRQLKEQKEGGQLELNGVTTS